MTIIESEHDNEEHWDDHPPQHYHDINKPTELIQGIGGTDQSPESIPSDKSKEVLAIMAERYGIEMTAKQLMLVLSAASTDVQRVVQAASEVIFKNIYCQAGVAVKATAMGFNRSRLTLVGNNQDVSIGDNQSITVDGLGTCRIGFLAGGVFRHEVRTVRDVWIIATQAGYVGVQEEFVA